jgi:hypothetical protein
MKLTVLKMKCGSLRRHEAGGSSGSFSGTKLGQRYFLPTSETFGANFGLLGIHIVRDKNFLLWTAKGGRIQVCFLFDLVGSTLPIWLRFQLLTCPLHDATPSLAAKVVVLHDCNSNHGGTALRAELSPILIHLP